MDDVATRIPFHTEELSDIIGRTILGLRQTGWQLLLVFTDRTAVVIQEDTSGCFYPGETGEMDTTDPDESDMEAALEIWKAHEKKTREIS